VRPAWALCLSTYKMMLQRQIRIKIYCDFWQLARVSANRGKEIVVIEHSGEGHLIIICFTLMTS